MRVDLNIIISSIFALLAHEAVSFVPSTSLTSTKTSTLSPFLTLQLAKDEENIKDETWVEESPDSKRRNLILNAVGLGLLGVSGVSSAYLFQSNVYTPSGFQRIYPTQFIAALGDPKSSQGNNAQEWGVWRVDPGPRGVWLDKYNKEIVENKAPAGWTFDINNWWLEEHGLIMEAPQFPLKAGRYLVTGGRMVTTGMTVDNQGNWKLDEGTLYDVTHLPCRSARYTPKENGNGSPLTAKFSDFPVKPGAIMPTVEGCDKLDYAVLFVVGKEV